MRKDGAASEIAWLYTGSHNLSGAAWGVAKKADDAMKILSFELGVLATPRRWAASVDAEAAQVAAGRFPPAAWRGVSGILAQPLALKLEPPTPPPRFIQLPWQRLRRAGGAGGVVGEGEGEVWLPIPFLLPPRKWAPADVAWTNEGVNASSNAPLPGLDGFGRSVHVREPGMGVREWAEAIPRDPGPLAYENAEVLE
jgi:hypothetical protein